jgi:hypothetical protein
MKNYLFLLIFVAGCAPLASTSVRPTPNPEGVFDTIYKRIVILDTVRISDTIWVGDTLKFRVPIYAAAPFVVPPPLAYADYAPYFQKQYDSCIARQIPNYFLPAGRFPMKEPLIGKKKVNGSYVFWTTNLIGTGTAGESDGSGTIFDFTQSPNVAFGIGLQDAKGVIVRGIKVWGAFNPPPGDFYNSSYATYGDGKCRDKQYSPYAGIVIDPFGPSVPADGGFPGTDAYGVSLTTYYFGNRSGSTGVHLTEDFITGWVVDVITSPNGLTQNADNLTYDFLQVGNSKTNFAGCQDQEKNNTIDHIMSWGQTWMIFSTGLYGAGSVGAWNLHWFSIAGKNHDFIYNNQSGYFQTNASYIFAESLKRLGTWISVNGSKMTSSVIGFAAPDEVGTYTPDMISGYGVTFDGCQLRMYGWPRPITIDPSTGAANNFHFINCSMEGGVPVYPQTYPYGYTDFSNCYIGGVSSANVLNPIGPSLPSVYAYPGSSNVAAKNFRLDASTHKFSRSGPGYSTVIKTDSGAVGDVITATINNVIYLPAGWITAKGNGTITVSYTTVLIDTSKNYYLYRWKTVTR